MFRRSVLGSFAIVALCASAVALDTFGPPFGANKYTSSITTVEGIADTDDYVAPLLAGETLSVALAANKGSTLLPALALVDPDGLVTAPSVVEKSGGTKVSLTKFVVTKTGRWGVRVSGKNDTQGAYSIGFVVGAAPGRVVQLHLGAADAVTADLGFDGLDGALLDLTVKGSKKAAQVHVGTLKDPSGVELAAPAAVEKAGSAKLSHVVLRSGDGRYTLRLFIDSGEAACSVSFKVTPQGRPKSKKVITLAPSEPALDPRDGPIQGVGAGRVHLTGVAFPSSPPPLVYFGRSAGTAIQVAGDGRSLDVDVPAGIDDATVSVAVVAADGQAAARDAYFHYVPPPSIVDLTNATGKRVRGGSSVGGQAMRLIGTGFEAGQRLNFGTRAATIAAVVGSTRIDLTSPPGPADQIVLALSDNYGRVIISSFLFEYKAPPAFSLSIAPLSPLFGAVGGGTATTINGQNFESTDRLVIGGTEVASTYVSASKRTFASPNLAAGLYTLALVDRFDASIAGPQFEVKAPPSISTVQAIAGAAIGTGNIALGGGATVRVTGSAFRSSDTVKLGLTTAAVTASSATQVDFTAPPGPPGVATLTITDVIGQTGTASNAIRYVGYDPQTASRSPGASSTDDLSALRGAMGDLDGDGQADDLVIVSDKSSPGSRTVFTRIFFGVNSKLADQTSSKFPAAGADPQGIDDFRARTVAIGDLDTSNGKDVVIAGTPTFTGGTTGGYYYYYYPPTYFNEARIFTNNGSGTFSFSTRSPPVRTSAVTCRNGSGTNYPVFTPGTPNGDNAEAIAIGDIDHDTGLTKDIVTVGDHFRTGTVHIAPGFVTFTPGNYVDLQASTHYSASGSVTYAPALRIFQNRGSSGFLDVTFPRVPLGGTGASGLPAYHGRDVKLGDIDGDGDLDIVLTWDDPTTVTASGLATPGSDTARIATRVLLNNGSGFFTDATNLWMPAGTGTEFWQANRLELVDLDGDGDLDLVLLHAASTDAYLGPATHTSPALRILRNDGASSGFHDVTSSALPGVPVAGTRDDNLRGTALVVADVDGDGKPDILVGTNEALLASGTGGQAVRRTRLLRHGTGLTFTFVAEFLPAAASDTGEAGDLVLGDLAGNLDRSLFLLTETAPGASPGGEHLRVHDWVR